MMGLEGDMAARLPWSGSAAEPESNRAIARMTGLSESNVGTILHRIVATLRREW